MKHLKGIITAPKDQQGKPSLIHLTCCSSIPEILIGDVNLHDWLKDQFSITGETAEQEFENYGESNTKPLEVKYIVLDHEPTEDKSFNDLAADAINDILSPEYVNGWYSEWTCGYGGFDFFVNGHSIFEELSSNAGKWIFLNIGDF